MSSVPKNAAMLGGILAFYAALLVALLRDCPPLVALKRGALAAALVAGVIWVCGHVALAVICDGLRSIEDEDGGT